MPHVLQKKGCKATSPTQQVSVYSPVPKPLKLLVALPLEADSENQLRYQLVGWKSHLLADDGTDISIQPWV